MATNGWDTWCGEKCKREIQALTGKPVYVAS